jgi:hypothetical protein
VGTATITPSAAQDYQGTTQVSQGNLIGWTTYQGMVGALTVRYTFKSAKKLKGITAKIKGTLYGTPDGRFRYALSTSSAYPSEWAKVAEEGEGYLLLHYTGELKADTTYYLFVTKEAAGNNVYYGGCSAANVTITGATAGAGKVYRDGEWRDVTPKVYKDGAWRDAMPKKYDGKWGDLR